MPGPVSDTVTSTKLGEGCRAAMLTLPPAGVCLKALSSRLLKTCSKRSMSPFTGGNGSTLVVNCKPSFFD